jgi:hypothetical protein
VSATPHIEDPLIEAAVRPLADNAEMRLAAAGYLEGIRCCQPEQEREAIAVWTKATRPSWLNWRMVLGALMLVFSVFVAVTEWGDVLKYYQWSASVRKGLYAPPPDFSDRVFSKLDSEQRLLVFGDPGAKDPSGRREVMWRKYPENPAYFSEYAGTYLRERNELVPGYFDEIRKIDPNNAWFLYFAAIERAKGAVFSVDPKPGASGAMASWWIKDQKRLEDALRLIREAGALPECESYAAENLSSRLAVLPNEDFMDNMESVSVLAAGLTTQSIHLMHVQSAIHAQAARQVDNRDAEGFRLLSNDAEALLRSICNQRTATLIEQVIHFGFVKMMSKEFAKSAGQLGLTVESEKWRGINERAQKLLSLRKSKQFTVDGSVADPVKVTGRFFGTAIESLAQQSAEGPVLTDELLQPGRTMDHEILSRGYAYALWILTGVLLLLVVLFRFRTPRMLRCMAGRVEELLRPSDWAWVLGFGVLLPLGFVMAINRYTPLGGRDYGLAGTAMLLPAGHFIGLFLLWWVAPVLVIRQRLANRAGFFGFAKPGVLEWMILACTVAFVFVIGWCGRIGEPGGFWEKWMVGAGWIPVASQPETSTLFYLALALMAVPVIWLLGISIRSLCGVRLFQAATVSKVLSTAQAAALLSIALASFGFKAAEQNAFRQDRLMRFDPAFPGWTRYEFEVADQARKELLKTLGPGK